MKKRSSSQSSWALLTGSVADARVESHRIRHLVNRGQKIVENSVAKDHLYEVAGDLIMGIPERLSHLERLLDRTSYALSLMGEDFFRGRLSIDDKEMVDQAVKFSQSAFPSTVQRVASRFLQRKASAQDVIDRANKALASGKIDQAEHSQIVSDHTNKQKPNMSGRLAGILYGRARFPFRHKDKSLHTKVKQQGAPNGVKAKVPNFNVIGDVVLEAHAFYRYELRNIGSTALNEALNAWSDRMNKGYLDITSGIPSRRNTDNAEFYRSYKKNNGRGSDNFYHQASDTTLVISAAPKGTTNRFDLFIVTMYKGQSTGGAGYRSRFASERIASVKDVIARADKALAKGRINQSEYDDIVSEHTHNPNPNMNGRLAGQLYGNLTFPFRHKSADLKTKVKAPGKPNGVATKKPNFNVVNDVTLRPHAVYRFALRDITATEMNNALNSWSNKMNRGYFDITSGIPSRASTDNAELYESYSRDLGKGSFNFYDPQSDTTIVVSVSPVGTTNRYSITVVTVYKGKGSGGYRPKFAYRAPASELPGASTWVNEDSKKNLTPNTSKGVGDNAESRERSGPQTTENKQQALPIRNDHSDKRDQKMPISQTDGKGTARPQFNTPPDSENAEGGRSIHKDKVRTKSLPGDEYGTPYKDDGYSLTRRTMKGSIVSLAERYLSERNER